MSVRLLIGDVREKLAEMPDESVHCVVTSPPYWGLRDYGVEGQIGIEETVAEHIDALTAVFRAARRVLRADGTLWLNYGDAYAGSWGAQGRGDKRSEMEIGGRIEGENRKNLSEQQILAHPKRRQTGSLSRTGGCKAKDLMMMPARVAMALQADGWWLRSDIIWHKPNPMPESITDRPTSAHEHIFLMAKSERYFYDADAVREACNVESWDDGSRVFGGVNKHGANAQHGKRTTGRRATARKIKVPGGWDKGEGAHGTIHRDGRTSAEYVEAEIKAGRNLRNVWTVATSPYSEAHFATFPPALIEPCIKAGCPAGGTVLDPFFGAGTTGLVADRLGRDCIGIEINPAYAAMARLRMEKDAGMFLNIA